MKFLEFAKQLIVIETEPSRLIKVERLIEILKLMSGLEIELAVWLSMGKLGPAYESTEFQVAEKTVIRVIASVAEKDVDEITKTYKVMGDLGQLIETLEGSSSSLTIEEIYDRLHKIALLEGTGSQEDKRNLLTDLLNHLSAMERKVVVRIILGKLRTGFSDKTWLDVLVKMHGRNKEDRKQLDTAYQIYPNIGVIMRRVVDNGWDLGLKEIETKVGVPIMPALCQRLNSGEEIIKKMGRVVVEKKYDGTRVQIHFSRKLGLIKSFTRNLEESSQMFPELMQLPACLTADDVILDCEAIGYDEESGKLLQFQSTITRKRKHNITDAALAVPLRFFVFDILYCDGVNLLNVEYWKRREMLKSILTNNSTFVVDEVETTDDPVIVKEIHEKYLSQGFEGAVIKKIDGEYLPGRQGWNWVKIKEAEGSRGKLVDTLDLVVLGYYKGKGKRADFGIGAFLVGLKKDDKWISITKIGTGLSDSDFREMYERLSGLTISKDELEINVTKELQPDVWVRPEIVVEIAADEITTSKMHEGGLALRFPRMIRWRDDKSAEQATSWQELLDIQALSGGGK